MSEEKLAPGHLCVVDSKVKNPPFALIGLGNSWGESELSNGEIVLVVSRKSGVYSPASGILTVLLPTGRVGYIFEKDLKKI
jgi:hypothetical protein